MTTTLAICDCLGSQRVHPEAIEAGADAVCTRCHTALCADEAESLAALMSKGSLAVACAQETRRFEEIAAEIGAPAPPAVDIRDRAGWSDEAAAAGPKQAALVADALMEHPAARVVDVVSEGLCMIFGPTERALGAAELLADTLAVTVCLTEMPGEPPLDRRFDIVTGTVRSASGAFGGFLVRLDALRELRPGGRGAFTLTEPRDGAETACDIILDLTGEAPLFPAPDKREGYLRADPGSPTAVSDAVFEAGQLRGTFEKNLYVRLKPELCAHSRAGKTACVRCIDICPTGAIAPAGEHVEVDAMVCAGCGACSAVCPSGAIAHDAPDAGHLFRRMDVLASAFIRAGGAAPRLLVHDNAHGAEMIALSARFGRGLPSDVIPMGIDAVSGFGHAEILAALASGFGAVDILLSPTTERDAPVREMALAEAMGAAGRSRLLEPVEPDALEAALRDAEAAELPGEPVLAMGSRRQTARLAAKALSPGASILPLPEGAPYGAILVDTDACTLCLSCAGLCPSGALGDNPDAPQLRFQEDACLQCGLCAGICPEDAIVLEPRMNLADDALSQRILKEEEPHECVECGKPFGVKSTVDRIVEQLGGKHPMFADGPAARMIRMCDDCRVKARHHGENNPFAAGERPRPRTAADYQSEDGDG